MNQEQHDANVQMQYDGAQVGQLITPSGPTIHQQIESLFGLANDTEASINRLEAGVDALVGAEPSEACSTSGKGLDADTLSATLGANIRYHETNARRLSRAVDRLREYIG